jgi:hypothetical protein
MLPVGARFTQGDDEFIITNIDAEDGRTVIVNLRTGRAVWFCNSTRLVCSKPFFRWYVAA